MGLDTQEAEAEGLLQPRSYWIPQAALWYITQKQYERHVTQRKTVFLHRLKRIWMDLCFMKAHTFTKLYFMKNQEYTDNFFHVSYTILKY